jgi:mercuric reductase
LPFLHTLFHLSPECYCPDIRLSGECEIFFAPEQTRSLSQLNREDLFIGENELVRCREGITVEPKYDLIIIGTGAAGTSAAARAVHLGARRVALVERNILFGTCINVGCIPSKFLLALGNIHYYRDFGHRGLTVTSRYDPSLALAEKESILGMLRRRKEQHLFEKLGIELIKGTAGFESPDEIRVDGRTILSDRFIIATGSSPSIPDIQGLTTVPFMTNIEGLEPEKIPESLIVVGGRALGLEFAQLYAHLGSRVTLLQRSSLIVPEEEPEISRLLTRLLMTEGIRIETGTDILRIRGTREGVEVSTRVRGAAEIFTAERILMATGRAPNTRELNLEAAGVKTGKNGAVLVDETMRTSSPSIWAAGDVLGEPQLEPAAAMGGRIAAENALLGAGKKIDLSSPPHAVYTMPQIASVGLTESQAREKGIPHECRSISLDTIGISAISGNIPGMVKLVAEKNRGKVLGVHICAPVASEMIHEGICAVKFGLTVDDLIDTLHIFPTYTGALQVCARSFRKDLTEKEACD